MIRSTMQDYQLTILFRVVLFAALGLAWNLVGGYAGQLSLGHAAYFGIGGYGLALFYGKLAAHGASGAPAQHDLIALLAALILAVLVAAVAAAIIGRVSFRLRGPYFALATLAFAEVLHLSARNLRGITGGQGEFIRRTSFFREEEEIGGAKDGLVADAHRFLEALGGRRAAPAISVGLGVGFDRRQVRIKNGGGAIDRRVDDAEVAVAHPAFGNDFGFGLVVFDGH